jgi:hypothetical protein
MDGQTDEDHLIAAIWNLCGLAWTEEKRPEMQDIPSRMEALPIQPIETVERDCEHGAKHTAEGCCVWECKFEPKRGDPDV